MPSPLSNSRNVLVLLGSAVALVCILATTHAKAQPSAPRTLAEPPLVQAERALAEGRFALARVLFTRAEALVPDVRARAGLGLCALGEGDVVNAYVLLREALAERDDALADEARTRATDAFERASARVGRVRLDSQPRGADIMIGGAEPFVLNGTMLVAAGEHLLVVLAPGFEPAERTIIVQAGRETRVRIRLARERASRSTGAVASWIPPASNPSSDSANRGSGRDPTAADPRESSVVTLTDPPSIVGSLEEDVVRRLIEDNMHAFRACADTAWHRDDGVMSITFTVDASGRTSDARVASTPSPNLDVDACATRVIAGMRYAGARDRAPVHVAFALLLDYAVRDSDVRTSPHAP